MNDSLEHAFIDFALKQRALRFGEFQTKAGRLSPYFFNAGLFDTGVALARLCEFYAKTVLQQSSRLGVRFDMLFGPAYKGIPLVAGTAMQLAALGHDTAYAFNRKEAKDHGEGGMLVGAPLQGRVVIVDDVISAGTSVKESVDIIRAASAQPVAVLIALDRMEKAISSAGMTEHSAVQEVEQRYGIPVMAIASLRSLLSYLESWAASDSGLGDWLEAVRQYRARYGVE